MIITSISQEIKFTIHGRKIYKEKCVQKNQVEEGNQGYVDNNSQSKAISEPVHAGGIASTSNILQTVRPTTNPVDSDDDVLVQPVTQVRKKINNRKTEEKYFILTSEEAYEAKVRQKESKEKLEKEKQMRLERRNKKMLSNKENKQKSMKQTSKAFNKEKSPACTEDTTACMHCEIQYCYSNVEWVKCKMCRQWACADCAHMGRKTKIFICDSCK